MISCLSELLLSVFFDLCEKIPVGTVLFEECEIIPLFFYFFIFYFYFFLNTIYYILDTRRGKICWIVY